VTDPHVRLDVLANAALEVDPNKRRAPGTT